MALAFGRDIKLVAVNDYAAVFAIVTIPYSRGSRYRFKRAWLIRGREDDQAEQYDQRDKAGVLHITSVRRGFLGIGNTGFSIH